MTQSKNYPSEQKVPTTSRQESEETPVADKSLLEKISKLQSIVDRQNESLQRKFVIIDQQASKIEELRGHLRAKEQVIHELAFFRNRLSKTYLYKIAAYCFSLSKRPYSMVGRYLNRK